MKIVLGGDHYAVELIEKIQKLLEEKYKIAYTYFGSKGSEDVVTLPDFIKPVCEEIIKDGGLGILVCGTGAGVNIGANKYPGIRAVLCRKPIDAEWAREKDNANIICLASWDTDDNTLGEIIDKFLGTSFKNEKIMVSMSIMEEWRKI